MKIARGDLNKLRLPLALAIALLALGAASVITSEYYLDEARQAQSASRLGRVAAQERVSRVAEEEREIREHLLSYEQMRRSGMVGDQSRLDWIESIARIKKDRKLIEIKYTIEAQKPLDYPGIVGASAGEFVMSRVKLEMLLLHEGDLLDFLADLRAAGKAHVSVRSCTVSRMERGAAPAALQPRLQAECQVDLVSIREIKPA
ncbi:MAG: hypothetical protein WBO23_00350 [Burkholderiales bacterium]